MWKCNIKVFMLQNFVLGTTDKYKVTAYRILIDYSEYLKC